jgi:gliding motility-associated-like protein
LTVTNTAGSSYNWIVNGATLTGGNGTNTINVDYTVAGTATIQVIETNSFGCIGDTVTLAVTVNNLPNANAGPDVGVCIGQSVQLNATGGTSYSWSPPGGLSNTQVPDPFANPSTNTVYTVLVTDVNGCQNSDSVLVTVNPLPNITVTPASSVCIGSSIQLNASGGNTYQWSPVGTLDNPNSASPNANPTTNTTYTVIVTDGNGCVDSATVDITVNPLPTAVAGNDTLICEGSSVMLSASGGVSFSWSPASSLNNPNTANPVATPPAPTTYTVTVTDANGCSDDDDVTVFLNDVPEASFTVDPNVISATCNGIVTNLINTSSNATSYLWLFPDGSTSTDVNPQYHFDFNSTVVTLIAYNNFCPDTTQQNFTGNLLDVIFKDIKNVFSPNGDNLNECFDLGNQYDFKECSNMKVFNRWGSEVFSWSPNRPCWNGKKDNTGEELPMGTYYLTIAIAGHKYQGTITLIR